MARSTWGSKRQKSKGVWELRYTVDGRQRSKTLRGSAKDADRELARLRMKYEHRQCDGTTSLDSFFWGVFVPECRERVERGRQLAEASHRLVSERASIMSPTTLRGYLQVYESAIKPAFGDFALEDIRAKAVQDWLLSMTYGKAKHAKAVLSAVLGRAETLEVIEAHPMRKRYLMPSSTAPKQRTTATFDAEELEAILAECVGEPWEAAFILAAFGGAQRSESLGVRPEEVSFMEAAGGLYAIVPIKRGVHRIDGEVEVTERTKNRYRSALAIVAPPASTRLHALVKEATERGEAWLSDDGFGHPMDPDVMASAWRRWLGGTAHRYVPFGNLRNSYSTMMHAKGLEDSTVSKLMRHANLTTDYTHYNRLGAEELISLIERSQGDGMPGEPKGF